MNKSVLILAAFGLTACEISEDPADGGFLSGVVGVAGGGYEQRVEDSEFALMIAQQQQADNRQAQRDVGAQSTQLSAQIAQLQAEYAALRQQISGQVAALRSAGTGISSSMLTRVNAVSMQSIGGSTEAARLASLQAAIADARALSADLARL